MDNLQKFSKIENVFGLLKFLKKLWVNCNVGLFMVIIIIIKKF